MAVNLEEENKRLKNQITKLQWVVDAYSKLYYSDECSPRRHKLVENLRLAKEDLANLRGGDE